MPAVLLDDSETTVRPIRDAFSELLKEAPEDIQKIDHSIYIWKWWQKQAVGELKLSQPNFEP